MEISLHQRKSSSPISSKSPTRGATPTKLRSSRLSYYPDDGCCSTAGPDVESYSEPLELVGPGGGRSSTSTLLPGYQGPSINVVGKNKGGCWVCGCSFEHRKTFCPIWIQTLADSRGMATRKTARRDSRRNPAAQSRVQGRSGAPQPRETAVASGGRKVRPHHQLVDGHHPHDSRPVTRDQASRRFPCVQLLTRSAEDADHRPHVAKGLQGPDYGLLPSEEDRDQDHLTDGDMPVMATQCLVLKTQKVTRCGGHPSFHYGSVKIAINQPVEVTPQECRDSYCRQDLCTSAALLRARVGSGCD
jgi:hypothetical protein